MEIWTKKFWKRTVTITVKTMAQAALGFMSGAVVLNEVDWVYLASGTGLSGVACILMAIAAPPHGSQDNLGGE